MTTTLDWYGCATFRLRTAGRTIFLDAYIDRVPSADGAGRSADDIEDCDWILVGHSHFDHLYGAERIMANTQATLVGSYETVRVMEAAGVPADRMICVAGGETIDLGRGVRATVFPSLHSCVWSHRAMHPAGRECLGDLGLSWQEQQARMAELTAFLATAPEPDATAHIRRAAAGHSPRGDGGALLYLLDMPDGTVLYQDTSGHWTGIVEALRPDLAIIAAAGRANIDGQPIQGSLARYVADHAARLRTSRVVLSHHDNWLPGFSAPTDLAPIRAALAAHAADANLIELGYVDGTEIF
jgi:L-ascorbate metabolism protein UlaG (beta-lactamase superfamily)